MAQEGMKSGLAQRGIILVTTLDLTLGKDFDHVTQSVGICS